MADDVGDALDVDVDDPRKLLARHFPKRCIGVDHGGIIDQQVRGAERAQQRRGPGGNGRLIGNIDHIKAVRSRPTLRQSLGQFIFSVEGEARDFEIDPSVYLPKDRNYFRYEGSLTTGDLDELVAWVVLRDPITIPAQEPLKLDPESSRLVLPLHRRFVLRSFPLVVPDT